MKKTICLLALFISTMAAAGSPPPFSDIIRNADGSIREMVQSSEYLKSVGQSLPNGELGALEYCASQGMRLPTIREWLQLAASLGAPEIIEVSQYRGEPNYYLAKVQTPDGGVDSFYVGSPWASGYQRPEGDLGKGYFWSSSVHPDAWKTLHIFNSTLGFDQPGFYDYDYY
ncbi:MAG: hypothetical protein WC635_12380 [Bacteriovorax sp.]|jgi:hypothetical protein